jgi:hypothetical protein
MVELADCRDRIGRWPARTSKGRGSSLRKGQVSEPIRSAFAADFAGDLGALNALPVTLACTALSDDEADLDLDRGRFDRNTDEISNIASAAYRDRSALLGRTL